MLSHPSGVRKLIDLYRKGEEETDVFVLSPVSASDYRLDGLLTAAADNEEKLWSRLERSQGIWNELAERALSSPSGVQEEMNAAFSDLEEVLRAVWIMRSVPHSSISYADGLTVSFLSRLLSAAFTEEGIPCSEMSPREAIAASPLPEGAVFVAGDLYTIPASTDAAGKERKEGESEYTASLIAASHKSPVTFWNSRSPLCTASRKDVPSAHVIKHLTYNEATELSFFGAPIIHPQSFQPASDARIPITLRCWGDSDGEATLITGDADDDGLSVKAFSVVRNVALINVEGSGMSGVPGFSSRLFTALRNERISVILISQASSEYSICFCVPQRQSSDAIRTIRAEFTREIAEKGISAIDSESDLAIIAAVGEGMPGHLGTAGAFLSSLGKAGINIRAIAQGSSERNISAVIRADESGRALRALHSVFFLSQQTLSVGLFGPGNIGGTLLDQLSCESDRLRRDFDLDIRVRGIATSKRMLLSEEGIDLQSWRERFRNEAVAYNESVFLSHIAAQYYPHKVIIDCTSSEARAMQYQKLIEGGFHIITPNKKAGSGPYGYYRSLMESVRRTGRKFLYETTVGAGLPVICTLKDLRETGDRVISVEGMVSGTLCWLFSEYDGTVPFSELVRKARSLGYTEPDPRDDLSGMDVARKTVILARELGYTTETDDIAVQSLVPEHMRGLSSEEFLSRLEEMDEHMLSLYRDAASRGMKLRYVGKVEDGTCSVSLKEYPEDHPFSQARGTDNVISFRTARYDRQPLVIKGPGAGPEVTAGGVFADILRLSAYLGSKV